MNVDFLGIFRYRSDYSLIYLFLALCLLVLVDLWRQVKRIQKDDKEIIYPIIELYRKYMLWMESAKDRGLSNENDSNQ